MFRTLAKTLPVAVLSVASLASALPAHAAPRCNYVYQPQSGNYTVIAAPVPCLAPRARVTSGSRVTLFGNFLGTATGCVLFNHSGTAMECNVVQWTNQSVTVDLPILGLSTSKDAEIELIVPDGRVAKTFAVNYIPQPDIVIHTDNMPVPNPPTSQVRLPSFITPVQGGVMLRAGE
jgi:hypothetical protein